MHLDEEMLNLKSELLGSFLLFTRVFFEARTGRKFVVSEPQNRESHHIIIAREFTRLLNLETNRLIINIEPGSGKSEMCKHLIAWSWAHYPDANFIYVSYSKELAAKHTASIKQIITLPLYRNLFNIHLNRDSSAKHNFKNNHGGIIYAAGNAGTVTGQDAGLPGLKRFSGALIIDDLHKPDEVHSDTLREGVITNYKQTLVHRLRGINVPILFMGQRLHEADIGQFLKDKKDGYDWQQVILKSLDNAGNALYPEVHPKEFLLNLRDTSPYEFASQYQQDPMPAGGGIFKKDWFVVTPHDPECIVTFIVSDTAESTSTYADYTVFTFCGLYKIKHLDIDTGALGIHIINCIEVKIEPKDLENEFTHFWADCMRYPVKPLIAAIEKKSTGSTLVSILKNIQGLRILEIERTRNKGGWNKTDRFLKTQPYIASKLISLPEDGRHTKRVIEHMSKITANDTHAHDDIADTIADAVQLALIDKTITYTALNEQKTAQDVVVQQLARRQNELNKLRQNQWR